jgi:hypothetical protein
MSPLSAILIRYAYMRQATLGRLILPSLPFALYTLELPWIPNLEGPGGMPGKSCVPDGTYALRPHNSPKHPNTWALDAPDLGVYAELVPAGQVGRTDVLIHVANQTDELLGCIGVGMRMVIFNDNPNLLRSRDGLDLVRSVAIDSLVVQPTSGTNEIFLRDPPLDPIPRARAPVLI